MTSITLFSRSVAVLALVLAGASGAAFGFGTEPAGNDCAGASSLGGGLPVTATGSTQGTDVSSQPPAIATCGSAYVNSGDVWYKTTGIGDTMTLTTCNAGTNFDTNMHVYCGSCDDTLCVAGNNNTPGADDPACDTTGSGDNTGSTVSWCSVPGATYFIMIQGGTAGASGAFELTLSSDAVQCIPPVDCPTPHPLVGPCCSDCGACSIMGRNDCIAGGGHFQASAAECPQDFVFTSSPNLSIPDNDVDGVTDTITVPPGSYPSSGIRVELRIDHTWQGDVVVVLSRISSHVILVSRPGRSSTLTDGFCPGGDSTGYSADNFGSGGTPLVISEDASVPMDCYDGPSSEGIDNYTGPARPQGSFSGLPSVGVEGGWDLIVSDRAGDDLGRLISWSLIFEHLPLCPGDMEPPVLNPCPDPAVVTLECMDPPPPPMVVALDKCDGPMAVTPVVTDEGDSCDRVIQRTWSKTDNAGNTVTCEQNFVVADTLAPVLTCPTEPFLVTCTGPEGILNDGLVIDVTAVDACGNGANITPPSLQILAPTCGGPPNILTYTATDDCGNESTCGVQVFVKGPLCCPALVDEELTLMIPNLDFTAQVGHDGGPVTTKAKFDIWNQNEIRFSGLRKCITCWDSTLLSLYPMPNLFLASNIQTEMGRARIDGVAEPQCVGAVATPLLGIITREITFAGCPLPSLRSSRPLTARGTQDARILYSPIDTRSAGDDALRVGPPENVAGTNRQGALLVWAKIEVKWDFAGDIIRDTFIELTNDGDAEVGFQLYLVNGEGPLAAVTLPNGITERAHQGWNNTDEQITLTPNEPTYWSAHTGAPKGITPFSNLDGGPPLGRPDPDPRNPGGRMVRGFVVGWAVNADGVEIKYNRLGGRATIVDYNEASAHEYETWVFRCVAPVDDLAQPDGTPGRLLLDGLEYDAAPEKLLTQFFVPWSPAFTNRGALQNFGGGMDATP